MPQSIEKYAREIYDEKDNEDLLSLRPPRKRNNLSPGSNNVKSAVM